MSDTESDVLTAIVCALHDSVMLLAPRGWTLLGLRFARVDGQLKLLEVETRGEGAKEPLAMPDLHLEVHQEARWLAEGVAELEAILGERGLRWTPGEVAFEKPLGGDYAELRLVDASGPVVWSRRISREQVDALLISEQLFDVLVGTQRASEILQGQIDAALGHVRAFAFDPDAGLLRLERQGGAVELEADLVGQYHPDTFTWVWGWSDASTPRHVVERFEQVCAPDVLQAGMAAFWRPSYRCDEGLAWAVAGSAVVSTAARGLFRAEVPDGSGAVFFALRELPADA